MFKRPEVWLLIVFAGAGSIWFAFFQEPAPELPVTPVAVAPDETGLPETTLELIDSLTEDSGDHWVIELNVRVENPTPIEQFLAAPFVKLVEPDGSEIPEFYLPFAKPIPLAPQETKTAELRYFVPKQTESLELALGERRLPLQLDRTTGMITPR